MCPIQVMSGSHLQDIPHSSAQFYENVGGAYGNSSLNGRKVDLSKWGIRFDGISKTMNVHEFLFHVEQRRFDNNCPESDVLKDVGDLLAGSALEFYWNWRKLEGISKSVAVAISAIR